MKSFNQKPSKFSFLANTKMVAIQERVALAPVLPPTRVDRSLSSQAAEVVARINDARLALAFALHRGTSAVVASSIHGSNAVTRHGCLTSLESSINECLNCCCTYVAQPYDDLGPKPKTGTAGRRRPKHRLSSFRQAFWELIAVTPGQMYWV